MLKNPQNRKNLLTFDFASDIIVVVSRDGAAWSARLAHNQEVVGSNPTPATKNLFPIKSFSARGLFIFAIIKKLSK